MTLLICIVGSTGEGKSEVAKAMIAKTDNACVWDVQDEYGLPMDIRGNLKKFSLNPRKHSIDDFIELTHVCEGYTFVCEEMTGYFDNGKIPREFTQEIVAKRHSRNKFILIFHSLQDIPPKIWRFTDTLILFKTEDLEKDVRIKYPNLVGDWKRLQTSTNRQPSPTGGDWTIGDNIVLNKTNLVRNKKNDTTNGKDNLSNGI